MNRIIGLLVLVSLLLVGTFALHGHGPLELERASAQTVTGLPAQTTTGTGIGDNFSGKGEMVQTWTGTLAASGAAAVVCTTTGAGTRISVKALEITCATAQFVDLFDGTTGAGATCLAHIYCAANTPHTITRDILGTGITTSLGNSLGIVGGSTGACYIVYSVQRPTQ